MIEQTVWLLRADEREQSENRGAQYVCAVTDCSLRPSYIQVALSQVQKLLLINNILPVLADIAAGVVSGNYISFHFKLFWQFASTEL